MWHTYRELHQGDRWEELPTPTTPSEGPMAVDPGSGRVLMLGSDLWSGGRMARIGDNGLWTLAQVPDEVSPPGAPILQVRRGADDTYRLVWEDIGMQAWDYNIYEGSADGIYSHRPLACSPSSQYGLALEGKQAPSSAGLPVLCAQPRLGV